MTVCRFQFLKLSALAAIVAACSISSAAQAATYYVSPCGQDFWAGVNVNCIQPLGPKRTIQAAINVANNGDTVMVMPGTYFEKIDLDGKAITLVGAAGPASTTIDGNNSGPVVTCNSGEGSNTVIQGFRITSGETNVTGGAMLNVLSSPTIIDCYLSGNGTTANGAAMANFAASPTIIDCIISFNQAGAEPPAANTGQGGGIYCVGGHVTISDTFFQATYATNRGGVIALFNNATATLNDCDFNAAGGLFQYGIGGGFYADNSTINAQNCTFQGVSAQEGGSVMAVNGSEVSFTSCTFESATGGARGGAASISNSQASFVGCEFFDLTANDGGAMYINAGTVTATLCGFFENWAWDENGAGGAILADNADLDLNLCTFTANTAPQLGGALKVEGGQLSMEGCNYSNNEVDGYGAAVAVESAQLIAESCTFTNNNCLNQGLWESAGGGIYFWSATTSATIDDCTFTDNTAASGGGLYGGASLFGATSSILVKGTTFENNHAYVHGGGAYVPTSSESQSVVTDTQFTGNTAVNGGGGLASSGVGRLIVHASVFTGNSAERGGAVQCSANNESFGQTLLSACRMFGNSASEGGAAVDVSSLGKLRMFNCVVNNNTSPVGGAAISEIIDGFWQGRFDIANCTIANNNGGGVRMLSEAMGSTVSNSIVWGNANGGQFPGALPLVRYSDVQGGVAGLGNISASPVFQGALAGNYRLLANSPCIDGGNNWLLPSDAPDVDVDANVVELLPLDFDGNPRIADTKSVVHSGCGSAGAVDIGAFEAPGVAREDVRLGDVNADGVVNIDDLIVVITSWGPCAGCCPADLNVNGLVDIDDLVIVITHWG